MQSEETINEKTLDHDDDLGTHSLDEDFTDGDVFENSTDSTNSENTRGELGFDSAVDDSAADSAENNSKIVSFVTSDFWTIGPSNETVRIPDCAIFF